MSLKTKLLFISIFLSFIPALSLAGPWNGWVYQNPYPTSNTLLAVKFVTSQKGWIAGEHGTILYTEDGGDTWEAQESGTEADIKSLAFINEKQGWAAGNYGVIIHTEDGGKTWVKQGDIKASLHIVFFINEKDGWAGGSEGTLLHTKDGGKNWDKQDVKAWTDIAGIFFKDANTGWVLSGASVFRTSDGGKNWESSELPSIALQGGQFVRPVEHGWEGSVFFLNENKGFVTVGLPHLFYTEDGGKTWQANKVSNTVERISFTDEKSGCIAGKSIFCTEDEGKTWTERLGIKSNNSSRISLWGISFADKSTGWAVGKDGYIAGSGKIFKTEDGGKSWQIKSRGFNSAYFLDSKMGWDLQYDKSGKASIVKTEDGGKSWKVQKVFAVESVDIKYFFLNSETGWAVGQERGRDYYKGPLVFNYFILYTKDGGKTWVTQFQEPGGERGISNELRDVFFLNPNTGWAVGSKGLILHTKDGGKHWMPQKSETTLDLVSVYFIDNNIGIAIGGHYVALEEDESAEGVILYTRDGGKHWRTVWKKPQVLLTALFFLDNNTAWVTAETLDGTLLLNSKDGGKTWSDMKLENIFSGLPYFINKDKGLLIMNEGKLFITIDGGKTWNKQRMPLRRHPWHVSEIFKVQ